MERRTMGGIEFGSVYVALQQSSAVRWTWTPAPASEASAPDHHGKRELYVRASCGNMNW